MNPGIPLKEATSWMVDKGHSISHSLPIAPASFPNAQWQMLISERADQPVEVSELFVNSYCGWTKSTSHHSETMGNHLSLVFTGESSFQGFLGGAGFCPSTVWCKLNVNGSSVCICSFATATLRLCSDSGSHRGWPCLARMRPTNRTSC